MSKPEAREPGCTIGPFCAESAFGGVALIFVEISRIAIPSLPDPQVINTLVLPELNGDTDSIFHFLYIRFAFPLLDFQDGPPDFLQ